MLKIAMISQLMDV